MRMTKMSVSKDGAYPKPVVIKGGVPLIPGIYICTDIVDNPLLFQVFHNYNHLIICYIVEMRSTDYGQLDITVSRPNITTEH